MIFGGQIYFYCIFLFSFPFTQVLSRGPYHLPMKKMPTEEGHARCGMCPTYFQKLCAFNIGDNSTFIFDNHCIMDIYNCIEGTSFIPVNYEHCMYFGNFAYIHGYKREDEDYGEDHMTLLHTGKNKYFT